MEFPAAGLGFRVWVQDVWLRVTDSSVSLGLKVRAFGLRVRIAGLPVSEGKGLGFGGLGV